MRSVHYSAVIERGEPIQSNSPISQAAAENITRVFKLFYTASGNKLTETLLKPKLSARYTDKKPSYINVKTFKLNVYRNLLFKNLSLIELAK